MKNLGHRAKYDRTSTIADGDGAQDCFTLFPGYCDENQKKTFSQDAIIKCLKHSTGKCRIALTKGITPLAQKANVPQQAVHQLFNHSGKVHEESYLRAMRNEVNDVQLEAYGW